MYKGKRIAVIIPARNEERLITPTLEKVPAFVDQIFVVNDGSTDQTRQKILDRHAIDQRVTLLDHEKNMGVGAATVTAYTKARDGRFDITVAVGGDDQMPMEQMERLMDPIIEGKADYVKGNRFMESDDVFGYMPRVRVIGNTIISLLTKIASGYYRIFDVVDGFTAISLTALERVDWSKAWKGYGFPMDFLIRMNAYGFKTIDVPRRAIYLKGERQSQIKGLSYALKVSPMLLRHFIWRLKFRYVYRDFHPLVLLFAAGALFFAVGMALGVWIVISKLAGNIPSAATAVICALFISLGIQSVFFAMLFEMFEDMKR